MSFEEWLRTMGAAAQPQQEGQPQQEAQSQQEGQPQQEAQPQPEAPQAPAATPTTEEAPVAEPPATPTTEEEAPVAEPAAAANDVRWRVSYPLPEKTRERAGIRGAARGLVGFVVGAFAVGLLLGALVMRRARLALGPHGNATPGR